MLSKEHYCYKINSLLMKSNTYMDYLPFLQQNLDPFPFYDLLKSSPPTINKGEGGFTLCDEEILSPLFLFLFFISLGQYGQKNVFKSWSFRKKRLKKVAMLSIEGRGVQTNLLHIMFLANQASRVFE